MDSAVGTLATVKELARNMLANCHAWRTIDGNSWTVEQAKARIYLDAFPVPDDQDTVGNVDRWVNKRPFAVIAKRPMDGIRFRHAASGPTFRYVPSGVLVITIHRTRPAIDQTDLGAGERELENIVGEIIESGDTNNPGLVELAGTAGYLDVSEIYEDGPYTADPKEVPRIGDVNYHFIELHWGTQHA